MLPRCFRLPSIHYQALRVPHPLPLWAQGASTGVQLLFGTSLLTRCRHPYGIVFDVCMRSCHRSVSAFGHVSAGGWQLVSGRCVCSVARTIAWFATGLGPRMCACSLQAKCGWQLCRLVYTGQFACACVSQFTGQCGGQCACQFAGRHAGQFACACACQCV